MKKQKTKHISCRSKCNFDGRKCNSNQNWSDNKCQCECKNKKKKHRECVKMIILEILPQAVVKMVNM